MDDLLSKSRANKIASIYKFVLRSVLALFLPGPEVVEWVSHECSGLLLSSVGLSGCDHTRVCGHGCLGQSLHQFILIIFHASPPAPATTVPAHLGGTTEKKTTKNQKFFIRIAFKNSSS